MFCSACSVHPPSQSLMDANWGQSVKSANRLQMLHPRLEAAPKAITGLEGTVGEKIMRTYCKRFEKEQTVPSIKIINMR